MKGIVVLLCVAALTAGCGGSAQKSAAQKGGVAEGVVATVGDSSIGQVELDLMAKGDLRRLDMEAYQIKKQVLDDLIQKRLIEQAAKKAGMSVDAYKKKMIDDEIVPPSEKEVRAVYDARKGADAMPFDNIKDKIAEYLMNNQRRQLEGRLIAKLKEENEVKVYLETPRIEIDVDEAPRKGSDRAPITIIDFSDYECGFSKRARSTVSEVLDNYGNKVRYIFKDYPLSFHRNATHAAEAAHCAGDQGKYFEYHDLLFKNQNSLASEDLKKYAAELNLDMKKFNKCVATSKYAKLVQESVAEGSAAGVSGTPAFFINGIMLSGAQPFTAFKEIIDAELEK